MLKHTRKKLIHNRGGFTMGEVLIAVAIIGILAAFAFVAVLNYQKKLKLAEMDSTARQIYMVAQNHMSAASANGSWSAIAKQIEASGTGTGTTGAVTEPGSSKAPALKTMGAQPADYPTDSPDAYNSSNHAFYAVTYNGTSSGGTELASSVLATMLPNGSIDGTVSKSGHYVIEFDAKSATVYAVTYTDDHDVTYAYDGSGYLNDYRTSTTSSLNSTNRDNRMHWRVDASGKQIVGYYGGAVAMRNSTKTLVAPTLTVNNDEVLQLVIKDPNYFGRSSAEKVQSKATLQIKGSKSQATLDLDLDTTYGTGGSVVTSGTFTDGINKQSTDEYSTRWNVRKENNNANYYFNLDDVTVAGGHIYNLMSKATNGVFIPGEDIALTVTLTGPQAVPVSSSVTVNSLFSSVNTEESKGISTAYVANGRHLQNLSEAVSGVNGTETSTSTDAVQVVPVSKVVLGKADQVNGSIRWGASSEDAKDGFFDKVEKLEAKIATSPDDYSKTEQSIYGLKVTTAGSTSTAMPIAENGKFYSIYNRHLESIQGKDGDDTESFKLSDFAFAPMTKEGKKLVSENGSWVSKNQQPIKYSALIGYTSNNFSASDITFDGKSVTSGDEIKEADDNEFEVDYAAVLLAKMDADATKKNKLNINKVDVKTDNLAVGAQAIASGMVGYVLNAELQIHDSAVDIENKANIEAKYLNHKDQLYPYGLKYNDAKKVNGIIELGEAAGMVARHETTLPLNITNSYTVIGRKDSTSEVVGGHNIGGLLGAQIGTNTLTLENDGASAYVHVRNAKFNNYVAQNVGGCGGFAGSVNLNGGTTANIKNCYSGGRTKSGSSGFYKSSTTGAGRINVWSESDYISSGGFFGMIAGGTNVKKHLSNCYSTSSVYSSSVKRVHTAQTGDKTARVNNAIGGFIGLVNSFGFYINDCYSTGLVLKKKGSETCAGIFFGDSDERPAYEVIYSNNHFLAGINTTKYMEKIDASDDLEFATNMYGGVDPMKKTNGVLMELPTAVESGEYPFLKDDETTGTADPVNTVLPTTYRYHRVTDVHHGDWPRYTSSMTTEFTADSVSGDYQAGKQYPVDADGTIDGEDMKEYLQSNTKWLIMVYDYTNDDGTTTQQTVWRPYSNNKNNWGSEGKAPIDAGVWTVHLTAYLIDDNMAEKATKPQLENAVKIYDKTLRETVNGNRTTVTIERVNPKNTIISDSGDWPFDNQNHRSYIATVYDAVGNPYTFEVNTIGGNRKVKMEEGPLKGVEIHFASNEVRIPGEKVNDFSLKAPRQNSVSTTTSSTFTYNGVTYNLITGTFKLHWLYNVECKLKNSDDTYTTLPEYGQSNVICYETEPEIAAPEINGRTLISDSTVTLNYGQGSKTAIFIYE